jgi:integrase
LKGCPDKRVTEEMARAAESEAAKVRAGLVDPKARRVAEAARRPVTEHVEDFISSMTNANRNPQHVAQTRTYITRILTLSGVDSLSDLTPSAVMDALGRLKGDGLSARSLEAHAVAVKSFSRWAWRDGRTADYALVGLPRLGDKADRRRVRRPLSEAELRVLIETTRTAPDWRGVSGADRVILYAVAATTGLRRRELKSLTPESFRLDDRPPTVVCTASYTKNGEKAEQPIPESLAATLRPWLAYKAAGQPVFGRLPQKTGLMLKADLERCGIEQTDASGRVVDMHSLRHGYITTLARAGVPVKTLQALARHSDPKLTLNVYSHVSVYDTAKAVEALPDLTGPGPRSEPAAAAATGTDVQPISVRLAHHLPTEGDGSGRKPTVAGGTADQGSIAKEGCNPLKMTGFDASGRLGAGVDGRVGDGIRTRDVQIHKTVIETALRLPKAIAAIDFTRIPGPLQVVIKVTHNTAKSGSNLGRKW